MTANLGTLGYGLLIPNDLLGVLDGLALYLAVVALVHAAEVEAGSHKDHGYRLPPAQKEAHFALT